MPGNTTVESYQKVNRAIYRMLPECTPRDKTFEIDHLQPNFVCSLKVAAEPMQHITNALRQLVTSMEGVVVNIFTTREGLRLEIKLANGVLHYIMARRVIIATGARPRTLELPVAKNNVTMIDPTVAFIQSELADYLQKNPNITSVAVIGSSHSAALATMHLLQAGVTVKQFMSKEYKYAMPSISKEGTQYTMYDNTGLKGEVAKFTKQLLDNLQADKGEYRGKLVRYIGEHHQAVYSLLEKHLTGCSHAVAAIGYEPSHTLQVNHQPLSKFSYDNETTKFTGVNGLFGIGIAFPQVVTAISGEIELAVGYGKFWETVNNPRVIASWQQALSHVAFPSI